MWAPPPSSPLHSRGGWGDPVLCQYVNNGLVYYYVCNEMFLHAPSGGFTLQIFNYLMLCKYFGWNIVGNVLIEGE